MPVKDSFKLGWTKACNFIKKETLAQVCFPVNFAKFLRTPFLTEQNTSGGCFWMECRVAVGHVYVGKLFVYQNLFSADVSVALQHQ